MEMKRNAKKAKAKVGALLVLVLFMASLVPAAFAQERSIPAFDQSGRAVRVSAQESVFFRAATDAENNMVQYIREEVKPSVAYDRCVELVRGRYPDVSQERVRMACSLRAHPLQLEEREERMDDDTDADVDVRAGQKIKERGEAVAQRVKINIDEARARYLKAKKDYAESREGYREEREKFREAKEVLNRCKRTDKGKCEEHRKEMRRRAPAFLFRAADTVLHTLNRVKANVEASDMDEERKAELLADLDMRIDAIMKAQATIENMDENTPSQDVQAAADTIRDEWRKSHRLLRHAVTRVVDAKLGNVIHRAEKLSEKLDRIQARLEAQGKDTTELDAAIDDFNAKLDLAVAAYAKAKAEFTSAKAGSDDASVKRAQELHKEARDALHDAQDALRRAVKEIRELNGSLDDREDNQEEEDGESGPNGSESPDGDSEQDEEDSDGKDEASDDADDESEEDLESGDAGVSADI